ncbi:MAG: T9SS type A sorting domain-containing protein [Gemmatimonadota bacterium]
MHSLRGKRGRIATLLFALAAATALPSPAAAGPEPGAKSGSRFRLLAGSLGAMTINRVYYGLSTGGLVGVDSTNSSTIGGGFWPKGTGDQYMFNSGLQVSGIIKGAKSASNPWGGDTTGGFFFDPKGTTEHGIGLTDLYNAGNPGDVANWPSYGFVPQGDTSEVLFDPLLRGRLSGSQGDVWFLTWEGDPGVNAGRPHPLGIVAEYRGLGWNYPAGNEDILYFIITFYNVTSVNPADYANVRDGLREKLVEAAGNFQRLNNAKFGITLPTAGYTINPFYAAFAADADVAAAGANFASVNLPFAMGYVYDGTFSKPAGWQFDPAIFGKPFFAGSGFVGVKYLKAPSGAGQIQLFSLTTNGGSFPDPANTTRLFRYMSGDVGPDLGVACNQGVVQVTHICYVKSDAGSDVRILQSASADSLKPGESKSIVVAYIHAAPVALAAYQGGAPFVPPGDPTRLSNPGLLVAGANKIDSLTGFNGYTDANNDGIVQQSEIKTIPGSLLNKGLTAQAVFDAKFLLPFSPEVPEFFLIPGDEQVTVLWKPSASEAQGDAYFQIASTPTVTPPGGGAPVPNPLYDPNYRKFDVEGYRIYRGRIDSPNSLKLIAQYDYAGTEFKDFGGQVPLGSACAPEISVTTSCAGVFDPIVSGVGRTKFRSYDISGEFFQVKFGNRVQLISGDILNLTTDTLITGKNSGFPALANTGVPFVYHDHDVHNGLVYYYAVTAFDVNSIQSGPSSLESPRITRRVTPNTNSANYVSSATLTTTIEGRGVNQTAKFPTAPTLDGTTGIFSGPQQPMNAGVLGFVGDLAKEVVKTGGALRVKLDSIDMGQMDLSGCCGGGSPAIAQNFYVSLTADGATTKVKIPVTNRLEFDVTSAQFFDALTVDPVLAAKFGANTAFKAKGSFAITMPEGPKTGAWSLGAALAEPGFAAGDLPAGTTNFRYNGARWFDGPSITKNEVTADPINGSCGGTGLTAACSSTTSFANAGKLTGVTTVYQPMAYTMFNREWRNMESPLSTVRRAADYNIYWGAAGKVDSVIDVTHNVVVPFQANTVTAGWGILNQAATNAAGFFDNRPGVLTPTDWVCVEPFRSKISQPTNTFFSCTAPAVPLSQTATLGPIAFGAGDNQATTGQSVRNPANLQANPGFSMIVAGVISMFEMAALPAQGTVWALRDYAGGIIAGGKGTGGSGNAGPYRFVAGVRPFTAVGAEVVVSYAVENTVGASTAASLAKVHTVPDPYYVTSAFEATTTSKIIRFVNLPEKATVRIYTSSGVLTRVLKQDSGIFGGELTWDVRNRNNQFVASGVYFYHVTAENGETTVGRMTIVNYAQ